VGRAELQRMGRAGEGRGAGQCSQRRVRDAVVETCENKADLLTHCCAPNAADDLSSNERPRVSAKRGACARQRGRALGSEGALTGNHVLVLLADRLRLAQGVEQVEEVAPLTYVPRHKL